MKIFSKDLLYKKEDKLFLIQEGDTCNDVTGGYFLTTIGGTTNAIYTTHTGYITLQSPLWNDSRFKTMNEIPINKYKTLCVDLNTDTNSFYGSSFSLRCNLDNTQVRILPYGGNMPTRDIVKVDIPDDAITEQLSFQIANTDNMVIYIYNIWLE